MEHAPQDLATRGEPPQKAFGRNINHQRTKPRTCYEAAKVISVKIKKMLRGNKKKIAGLSRYVVSCLVCIRSRQTQETVGLEQTPDTTKKFTGIRRMLDY